MAAKAKQVKALKNVRQRVQATHWVKGAMGKVKDARGHVVRLWWIGSPNLKDGKEVETFKVNGETYKTCGCLVGLMRWEVVGKRDTSRSGNPELGALLELVANHLIETGRVSKRSLSTIQSGSLPYEFHQNVIINWNDRKNTSRADVVAMLDELIP